MADQVPYKPLQFPDPSLAENPSQRCPLVLLLDISGSMAGEPLQLLSQGLQNLRDSLISDPLAVKRVDLAMITFGEEVTVAHDFSTVDAWTPPVLTAGGQTPMGAALLKGLDILRSRKEQYRTSGIVHYRPWVFLITNGGPSDAWKDAAAQVHAGQAANQFSFFAVGVEGANMDILTQISPPGRVPLSLKGLAFKELFVWLSSSMKSVSKSRPGDDVTLENPTAPGGWAKV